MTKAPTPRNTPAESPSDKPFAPIIRTRERVLAGALGAVFGIAGVAATFITNNSAGSTTLVVVSAIFLLLAVAGLLPRRLKAGDTEFEFMTAAVETLMQMMRETPPEVRDQLGIMLTKQLAQHDISEAKRYLLLWMLQAASLKEGGEQPGPDRGDGAPCPPSGVGRGGPAGEGICQADQGEPNGVGGEAAGG